MNSFENEKLEIVESLFADDTTILGTKEEIFIGRNSVMEVMNMFEEKCHLDKEEHLFLVKVRVSLQDVGFICWQKEGQSGKAEES